MAAIKQLKTMSTMKVAVSLCTDVDFKNELLNGPRFEYDGTILTVEYVSHYWKQLLHSKADDIKRKWPLPIKLHEDVRECVIQIAMQMMEWCRYHEAKYGLSHSFCVKFLNGLLIADDGKIDRRRAIEELIENKALDVSQRFKLACGYMMVGNISDLWTQLTAEERSAFLTFEGAHNIPTSQLPKVWARYLHGPSECPLSDCHNLGEDFWKQSFEQCVYDLNEIAVGYCFDNLSLHDRDLLLKRVTSTLCYIMIRKKRKRMGDILLSDECYCNMVCVLFSQMSTEVKRLFLRQLSVVLLRQLLFYLMCYHLEDNLFLESLQLTWDCQPPRERHIIVFYVMSKVMTSQIFPSCNNETVKSKLCYVFKEMWRRTSDDYKNRILEMWSMREFRRWWNVDRLMLIVKMLTYEEKLNVIFSDYSNTTDTRWFLKALFDGRLDVALWLVDHSGLNEIDKKQRLKKELHHVAFTMKSSRVSKYYIVCPLAEWCLETSAELNDFKRKWINKRGRKVFCHLLLNQDREEVEQLLRWFSLGEEEACNFKKQLFHSSGADLQWRVSENKKLLPQKGYLDEDWLQKQFYSWFGLTQEEVLQLKRDSVVRYLLRGKGNIFGS